jgi:hypothetical protein
LWWVRERQQRAEVEEKESKLKKVNEGDEGLAPEDKARYVGVDCEMVSGGHAANIANSTRMIVNSSYQGMRCVGCGHANHHHHHHHHLPSPGEAAAFQRPKRFTGAQLHAAPSHLVCHH